MCATTLGVPCDLEGLRPLDDDVNREGYSMPLIVSQHPLRPRRHLPPSLRCRSAPFRKAQKGAAAFTSRDRLNRNCWRRSLMRMKKGHSKSDIFIYLILNQTFFYTHSVAVAVVVLEQLRWRLSVEANIVIGFKARLL